MLPPEKLNNLRKKAAEFDDFTVQTADLSQPGKVVIKDQKKR